MSSKYLEKAWCYKTVSMEEKLLLVALAELSDRDGAFITSMTELKAMMCASERSLDNLISKLSLEQTLVGTNKSTPAYRSEGKIKGRLNFDTYVAPSEHAAPYGQQNSGYSNQPPHQAQQQSAPPQAQDTYRNTNRLSSFHRSQVAPINKSITGKSINIMELSPSVVEDWAEMIMFKSGFVGQTNIWASFVERVKETPNRQLYTLDELTSRLHSHLHSEKTYRQPSSRKQAAKPQVKHSALDVLEEKISNFNFNDDN